MAAFLVSIDARDERRVVQIGSEPCHIETEGLSVLGEERPRVIGRAPGGAVLIDQVMHFPELPLLPGCFCRDGGETGVLMAVEGEVAEDDAEAAAIFFFQLMKHTGQQAAGRTLEISKLFNGDGRPAVAAKVRRSGTWFGAGSDLEDLGGCGLAGLLGFRAVEKSAGDGGDDGDGDDKDERKVALHEKAGASLRVRRLSSF